MKKFLNLLTIVVVLKEFLLPIIANAVVASAAAGMTYGMIDMVLGPVVLILTLLTFLKAD